MAYKAILSLLFLMASHAMALVEVGDPMPQLKWQDLNEKSITLSESKGTVQVLLYNGGFCPDCQKEFKELVPQIKKYDGKNVKFISLSVAGWTSSSLPDSKFLKEWKQRYNIPFTVAASTRAEGKNFFEQVYIPNVVIVDVNGNLAFKAIEPEIENIFSEIDNLLNN